MKGGLQVIAFGDVQSWALAVGATSACRLRRGRRIPRRRDSLLAPSPWMLLRALRVTTPASLSAPMDLHSFSGPDPKIPRTYNANALITVIACKGPSLQHPANS